MKDLREKDDQKCRMLIPRVDCSIWDLAFFQKGGKSEILIAEDSGKVKMVDLRNNNQSIVLTEGKHQSALCLSVD